jgi:glycosyltransferase involved in cell wall biosynthesis
MKVAHYSTFLSRSAGGLLYAVSGLCKAQVTAGANVVVVGGYDEYFPQDREQWGDVPIHSHSLALGSYGFSTAAFAKLAKAKADLIHVHGIWSASSLYARVFSRVGVPVVVSPHGMLDPWILSRRAWVKNIHGAMLERPTLRRAHIHALSQSERESVGAYMSEARKRIFVIPNGTDAIADSEGAVQRSGVLYLGRLHAKKQVVELARLWAKSQRLQGTTLTVAGWGERPYEAELAAAVAGADNVKFVGALTGEPKARALRSARFFILPSLSEGMPMAVLEALQYGVIPIITDHCNMPELFAAKLALRIESDLTDLDPIVGAVIRSPADELDAMSAAGRQFSRRYLWSTTAEQMLTQYEEILALRGH